MPADSHRHGATTVAIEDWVQVELPAGAVRQRLVGAESWLPVCVKSGYRDAEGLRQGIDPTSLPWPPSATPAVTLAACDPGNGGDQRLTWEAGGADGPSSRFEGTLALHLLDEERTELRVEGKFRPPALAAAADLVLTERLSRATLRTTLREVAKTLEQPVGSRQRRSLALRS